MQSNNMLLILLLLLSSVSLAKTPLEVVNERMTAHNNHDLETFISLYSDDIQIYDFPDLPLGSNGRDHIRKIFTPLFKDKLVSVKVHQQMVNGNYVVNRETVIRMGKKTEYISIYEIENDLIKTVRFIK